MFTRRRTKNITKLQEKTIHSDDGGYCGTVKCVAPEAKMYMNLKIDRVRNLYHCEQFNIHAKTTELLCHLIRVNLTWEPEAHIAYYPYIPPKKSVWEKIKEVFN